MQNNLDQYTFTVTAEEQGQRLDVFLVKSIDGYSRARLQSLINEGHLTINGRIMQTASLKIKTGDQIDINIPPAIDATPKPDQSIILDIIYEDKDLIVLNKQAGLVVHPGAGHYEGTLVNALLAHCGEELSGIGGVKRPGIVHRLDKDTSGLMMIAKNDLAHQGLSAQLSSRFLKRAYVAFTWGIPNPSVGTIDTLIGRSSTNRQKMSVVKSGGREAITHYQVAARYGALASKVICHLETGRTHQIRVHLTHIKHSLIGDPIYKPHRVTAYIERTEIKKKTVKNNEAMDEIRRFDRQALHAYQISFIHPRSHKEMSFEAPLPDDLKKLEKNLEKMTRLASLKDRP